MQPEFLYKRIFDTDHGTRLRCFGHNPGIVLPLVQEAVYTTTYKDEYIHPERKECAAQAAKSKFSACFRMTHQESK